MAHNYLWEKKILVLAKTIIRRIFLDSYWSTVCHLIYWSQVWHIWVTYFAGIFYKMAIECWLLRALISSKIFLNYSFEDLLIHVGLVFTQLVVMSSSWNFPARAEPSWSTSIFELKPSWHYWQYVRPKIANFVVFFPILLL